MFLEYLMCVKAFIDKRNMISLSHNFLWTTKRHEELNMLMSFSLYVKVQQTQREQMIVMGFCLVLRYHPSKILLARYFALKSPFPSHHLLIDFPRSIVLLLVGTLVSQGSNSIETVVQAVTLEDQALEELCVITIVSLNI